ncbi:MULTISPECIES: tetratricopeptide repeat protein [unclassified Microcoleus]|uniref:tetratricopeptide repeat protein n=1 Tax=unclassified Microcoleus TaxID=2642155 RepID=UPI001D9B5A0E|nr:MULTISPECIES: tetratricopeptide repeat protein [unclassified Microcoleus]MCC3471958.1 tetratricopeptide repeat protein [Microcoleus sp. PH2017_13_LAR_U_A]MCC3484502.1 tetratricopeptide repeat protein [Microcoleus sp. PH2017_14_LAR_D_A]
MNSETAAVDLQQQAEIYLALGKLDRTIALCHQILESHPDSAETCKTLGKALQAQGKLEDARYWYKVAIAHKPDFAEAFANLGTLCASLQQWQEAIDCYQKAIALQPDFAGFYRNLSRIFTQVGQAEPAADCWYQSLIVEPIEIPEEYLDLGNTLLAQNKPQKALVCYHRTIYLNPSCCEAYTKLAEAASALKQWDEAIVNYRKAIKLQPDISEFHYKLGNVLQANKLWRQAEAAYRESIELNLNSFWSYYNLGSVLLELEQWQEAIIVYRTAVAIDPNFSWSYYSLGEAYGKLEKWSESAAAYQHAVDLDPNFSGSCHKLGDALFQLEKWSEAATAYQRAIALNSDFFWSHYNLALTLVKLQDWLAAILAYQRAIELNRDFSWAYHNLGEPLLKTQQWKAAATAYQRAIELNPNFSWSYYNLGDALTEIHNWNEAVSAYLCALQIEPDLPNIYAKLGDALIKRVPSGLDPATSYYHHELQPLHAPEFYCETAQKFAESDRPDAATVLYLMALEIRPQDAAISGKLAEILQKNDSTGDRSILSELENDDIRDRYIARVVKNQTFAEVGGLWGKVNEKVSVASKYGAVSLTMIDVTPASAHIWDDFRDRMASLNIANYNCISQDITQIQLAEIGEPYDVVHCAGVLYHHPHPLQILMSLRQITGQYLILTSAITQELIENERGRYEIPASGVIFIPALGEAERAILTAYWQQYTYGTPILGVIDKAVFDINDFGPWWWLPTAYALESMCKVAGFKVLDKGLTWYNNALTLLLEI